LKELSGSTKIYESDIIAGAMLVAVGVKTFIWDSLAKGNDIDVRH
jgi:hypothetical protein